MLPRKANTLRTILRGGILVQTGALLLITALGLGVFLLQQGLWDRARSDERTLLLIQELRSLAISREIVERHRGRVEIYSEVGVGSTFRVRLPLQDGA
jgi:hypothetical protein